MNRVRVKMASSLKWKMPVFASVQSPLSAPSKYAEREVMSVLCTVNRLSAPSGPTIMVIVSWTSRLYQVSAALRT